MAQKDRLAAAMLLLHHPDLSSPFPGTHGDGGHGRCVVAGPVGPPALGADRGAEAAFSTLGSPCPCGLPVSPRELCVPVLLRPERVGDQ